MLAYLDAGTGSMIVGAVAAGVAGAGVAVRSAAGRFFRKGKSASDAEAPPAGDPARPVEAEPTDAQ